MLALIAPNRDASPRWLLPALKIVGVAGLVTIAALFRSREGGWLRPSWWGILGLIGWAYLVCCCAFIASFNRRSILLALAALGIGLFVLDDRRLFDGMWIGRWIDIGSVLGTHGSIAICGAALGSMFRFDSTIQTPRARAVAAAVMIAACAVLAVCLHAPWGINKNAATPAWALWACCATALLWLIIYGVVDVTGYARWIAPLAAVGTGALLVYLLHPILYALIDLLGWGFYWRWGGASAVNGITRALLCAVALCAAAIALMRGGVRLRL